MQLYVLPLIQFIICWKRHNHSRGSAWRCNPVEGFWRSLPYDIPVLTKGFNPAAWHIHPRGSLTLRLSRNVPGSLVEQIGGISNTLQAAGMRDGPPEYQHTAGSDCQIEASRYFEIINRTSSRPELLEHVSFFFLRITYKLMNFKGHRKLKKKN